MPTPLAAGIPRLAPVLPSPSFPSPPRPPVWAFQSKTTVESSRQATADGGVKRSVGVASGQALAVNSPECWIEDCEKPVAQVGSLRNLGNVNPRLGGPKGTPGPLRY